MQFWEVRNFEDEMSLVEEGVDIYSIRADTQTINLSINTYKSNLVPFCIKDKRDLKDCNGPIVFTPWKSIQMKGWDSVI